MFIYLNPAIVIIILQIGTHIFLHMIRSEEPQPRHQQQSMYQTNGVMLITSIQYI